MMLETGRVVAVEPDAVWVETVRKTTCGSCTLQKGCGHGLMNTLSSGHRPLVRALPGTLLPADCRVDDEVQISIPEAVILRGSLVVYILPLLCMLAGGVLAAGRLPGSTDAGAAVGVVGGLTVGFFLVWLHARRHRDDRALQPTLVMIQRRAADTLEVA